MVEISDIQERKRALDITTHVHVESPAGAGKTGLIIERILALLAVVDHPSEILAVTFTRKAAAEMKGRVLEILKAADEGRKSGDAYVDSLIEEAKKVLEKYRGLRREMLLAGSDLRMTTIHSFCLQICRRAPLESGLEPWLQLADEGQQERLRELAAREVITELLERPENDPFRNAIESRLLLHNLDVMALVSEMASLLARRDQLGDLLSQLRGNEDLSVFVDKSRKNMAEIIRWQLQKLEEIIKNSVIGKQWDDFRDFLAKNGAPCLDKIPETCPSAHWKDLKRWQELADVFLTKSGQIRRRWGPKNGGLPAGFAKTSWGETLVGLGDEFETLLNEVRLYPDSEAFTEEVMAVEDLVLIVSVALRKHREICRDQEVVDYVDLELGALNALGNIEDVTESILFWDSRVKHILIDEFQDTSATEYRIVQRLVNGWEDGDGRTLFVVGDPKQSIYRFRKADVSIFYRAEKGIERSGLNPIKLEPIKLKTNFRSCGRLIEWTNSLFGETVMSAPRIEYEEVRFIEAIPAAPEHNSGQAPELALFIKKENELAVSARKREASYLANSVVKRLENLEKGETIGILLFTRTHLPLYLEAFKDAGVPLQVKEGLKLVEIPEVAHLANLTRAVVRPHDQLSWIACMRSPWLTLPISLIKDIIAGEGDTFFEKLGDFEHSNEEIQLFYRAMTRARARLGRDNLGDVVKKVWVELEGPKKVASFSRIGGVNACLRFLDELREYEKGSPEETLEEMEFFLESLYDPVDITAGDSPVFLMTVHGAKGLEFDHCFIPWLDYLPLKPRSAEKPAYLSSVIEEVPLMVSRPDKRMRNQKSVYDFLFKIEQRKTLAEAKRLFYVAVTRARKTLFMSGVWSGKSLPKGPLGWVLSHLGIRKLTDDFVGGEIRSTWVSLDPIAEARESLRECREEIIVPDPSNFAPEYLPYRVCNPSDEIEESYERENYEESEIPSFLKARGTAIHRIIEQITMGLSLPNEVHVEHLLRKLEVPKYKCPEMASSILAELKRCFDDPFFRWITDNRNFRWSASEWGAEYLQKNGVIISGVLDRIVFDGNYYWIIDYKTHEPRKHESVSVFEERMKERFAKQLRAYRELAARVKGASKKDIKCGLYLTAVCRWVEI